jgi:uncharacterized membrane protein
MPEHQERLEIIKKMIPKADASISMYDRLLSAISYISIFFLISLLRKKSTFVQLHARQGLVLFVICILINIAAANIPIVVWFFVRVLGNIAVIIFSLLGIFMALMGRRWKMPYGIGNWVEKWKIS